jgi:hypothetical protein
MISEGAVFGRWRVVAPVAPLVRLRRRYWKCRCECGAIRRLRADNLERKSTRSCGCFRRDMMAFRNRGRAA